MRPVADKSGLIRAAAGGIHGRRGNAAGALELLHPAWGVRIGCHFDQLAAVQLLDGAVRADRNVRLDVFERRDPVGQLDRRSGGAVDQVVNRRIAL